MFRHCAPMSAARSTKLPGKLISGLLISKSKGLIMNVLIELNQVDSRATRASMLEFERAQRPSGTVHSLYSDTDEPGENGQPEQPAAEAATETQPVAPAEITRPVLVNPANVRSITGRRDAVGSRLTFSDGGGYPVTETYDKIKELFASAGVQIIADEREEPVALISQG